MVDFSQPSANPNDPSPLIPDMFLTLISNHMLMSIHVVAVLKYLKAYNVHTIVVSFPTHLKAYSTFLC